jgi:hypothetical protein
VSAFVVSKEHIDLLVALAFTGPRPEPHGSRHWHEPSWLKKANPTPDDVGRMLLAENLTSVHDRYPRDRADELPGPRPPYWLVSEAGEGGYQFTRHRYRLTAVEGLKALACYEYQSCEHDGWPESDAHAFCRSLHDAVVWMLPGMEEAPWSWDQSAIAPGLTSARHRADAAVLDDIAALLRRQVRSPDTIADVAELVRASGRQVSDPSDDDSAAPARRG